MRVWPIILDSQPAYVRGRGMSTSLLLAPLGTNTLFEHLVSSFRSITSNAPLVVAPPQPDELYADWIHGLCPTAHVVASTDEFSAALVSHELSDALLIVDPRCLPAAGFRFAELMRHYSNDVRVSHHLVAFEAGYAGTRERVCFDASGHVRSIQRIYEQTTWPFVAGVLASVVPCASGIQSEGFVPRSLTDVRQMLALRGVPSRDLPIEGGALDLSDERGMLAANEKLVLQAAARSSRDGGIGSQPFYAGEGQVVHPTARVVGPVVLHRGSSIGADATVVGPAVIGASARIEAGAVVAHATVGPQSVVPAKVTVRDRAWFVDGAACPSAADAVVPVPYEQRLARLSMGACAKETQQNKVRAGRTWHLAAKRTLDVIVAAVSLFVLSPLIAAIAGLIRFESEGPAFYGDEREGRGGRVFRCWKFRTMYTGAHLAQRELKALDHTDGPHFKVDRDPRVTKVGRVLRALNLDEVPQLFNVLLGQMSLVGPRPSPFRENQVCVPWREARLSVLPGITGFWQVCRHNRSAGDFHQWIEYDLLYVQHLSFWLDLKILAATLLTLGGKALHIPASWLVGSQWSSEATTTANVDDPRHAPREAIAL